jgi:predicted nucleotidyltransferase
MIDLSASTDPELTAVAQVLAAVDVVAREAEVDYLVVGATSLAMLSIGAIGEPPHRATRDIDIAVAVRSWADFARLTGRLEKPDRGPQSFTVGGADVDVVPYGGVEDADRTIVWPNDHRMSVLGFREAVESAETVRLPGEVTVRIPSIAALALLKLVAWHERRTTTTRDDVDLGELLGWLAVGDRLDRVYDDNLDILERYDFDPGPAEAWLLGSDMSRLLAAAELGTVRRIVDDDDTTNRLARDTRRPLPGSLALVRAMRDGLCDGRGPGATGSP